MTRTATPSTVPATVLFQVELALEGVVHRLDQLPHRLQQGLALATFLPLG